MLEISGLVRRVRIDAAWAGCAAESAWDHEIVCTVPLPREVPGLEPGRSYSITVEVEAEDSAGGLREGPRLAVHRLDDIAQELAKQMEAISTGPLRSPARDVAAAAHLVRSRLYDEAIAALRRAQEAGDPPEVVVALGDLYQLIGLLPWAERSYNRALARDATPTLRAAALFGLGRVFYQRQRFAEA